VVSRVRAGNAVIMCHLQLVRQADSFGFQRRPDNDGAQYGMGIVKSGWRWCIVIDSSRCGLCVECWWSVCWAFLLLSTICA
jgi:hypothetical protein